MTKATKMPKLPMSPTGRDWDEYMVQMVQYQKERLERKDVQIAALKRKIERLENKIKAYVDHDNIRQAGNRSNSFPRRIEGI